jgi:putative membrane protein
MMWWNNGGGNMFFGPVFMILIVAVTIAAVVMLTRYLSSDLRGTAFGNQNTLVRTPLDILKEHFAKGEINKDEFAERRRVLEG